MVANHIALLISLTEDDGFAPSRIFALISQGATFASTSFANLPNIKDYGIEPSTHQEFFGIEPFTTPY